MVLVLFAFFRGAKRMLVSLPGSERGITVTFRGEVPRNNPVHPRHSSSGSRLPTPMCPPCRPGHGQHRGSQPEPSPLHPAQRPSPGRWVRILGGFHRRPPASTQAPWRRHLHGTLFPFVFSSPSCPVGLLKCPPQVPLSPVACLLQPSLESVSPTPPPLPCLFSLQGLTN